MSKFNKWLIKLDKIEKSLASTDGGYDLRVCWDNNEPYRWKDPITGEDRSGSREEFLEAGNRLIEWGDQDGEE